MLAYAESGSTARASKNLRLGFLRLCVLGVFFATLLCRYAGQPMPNALDDWNVSGERAG